MEREWYSRASGMDVSNHCMYYSTIDTCAVQDDKYKHECILGKGASCAVSKADATLYVPDAAPTEDLRQHVHGSRMKRKPSAGVEVVTTSRGAE